MRSKDRWISLGILLACLASLAAHILNGGLSLWTEILCSTLFPLAGIWMVYLYAQLNKQTLRAYVGLNLDSLKGSWVKALAIGAAVFATELGVKYLYVTYVPHPAERPPSGEFIARLTGLAFLVSALTATLIVPISEEMITRGFLQGILQRWLQRQNSLHWLRRSVPAACLAILFSSAVFAAGHGSIGHLPVYFAVGLLYGTVYRVTGSLYCVVIPHMLNNALCSLVLLFS